MKNNQKKHAVKGMSLVEIIISVVVLGVSSLLLVQVGAAVNAYRKNANHVSNRLTLEKPYVTYVSNGYYEDSKTNVDEPKQVKVKVDFSGHDVELKADCFKTVTDENLAKTNSGADLQFVNIDLSKRLTPKKTADGYYEMKTNTGRKIYKKGDDYYDESRNKINLEEENIRITDIYYDSDDGSNVWIDISPDAESRTEVSGDEESGDE